jgi:ABC-type lipoprotein release transport system permease subunit
MAGISARYAARSLRRNVRRTILSVVGIGIGCALALYIDCVNRGKDELYVRSAAESGAGHIRVIPAGWSGTRDPDLRLRDWRRDLEAARSLPGVEVAVPRARAQVLLALGTHVVPVEMTGVDPAVEPRAFRFVRHMSRGRYLRSGAAEEMVVGRAIADRLGADLGDEILASTVDAAGDIQGAMFRIAGVVSTGSEDIDSGICQVGLSDLERLTGRAGASEVTVLLRDWTQASKAEEALAARAASGDEVLTWRSLSPEFEGHLKQDTAASHVVTAIIILIVLLGVTSAQLAAVLERRREFAVLSAIGMDGGRLVRLVLEEGLALGLAGALAGILIALPFLWHLAARGLDFRGWMGPDYSFAGLIVEPVLYGDLGIWILPEAFLISLGATILASLYPAWYAARTDPAVALRVAP